MLQKLRACLFAISTLALAGCGLRTPNLVEFWGDENSSHQVVSAIVQQVRCELRHAVVRIFANPDVGPQLQTFMANWGAAVQLTLTVEETGAVAPGVSISNPIGPVTRSFSSGDVVVSRSFALGLGLSATATATRRVVINTIYPIASLNIRGKDEVLTAEICATFTPRGYIVTRDNLRIAETLSSGLLAFQVEGPSALLPNGSSGTQALQHQATFHIENAGGVNPVWTLARVTASAPGRDLLNLSRNRTQDLIVTFGPLDAKPTITGPVPVATASLRPDAQSLATAAAIASAITNSTRRF